MRYFDSYVIDGDLIYIPVNGSTGFLNIKCDMPIVPKESKLGTDPKSLDPDPDPKQIKILFD